MVPRHHGFGRRVGFLQVDAPIFQLFERNCGAGDRAAHERAGAHDPEIAVKIFELGLAAHGGRPVVSIEHAEKLLQKAVGADEHNRWTTGLKPCAFAHEMQDCTADSPGRSNLMRLGFAMLLMATTTATAAESIRIPGEGTELQAKLTRPAGDGPFPAVVALHGCSGLGGGSASPLYQAWSERLAANGYVVLFPDSFGSRGLGSQCRVRERGVRPRQERVDDAHAARRWLQQQSWVKPERVSLMGWSNGGSTVLWAVRPQVTPRDGPDFRAAIAFYPGCRQPADRAWSARLPTLILIGLADDWTPARPCMSMVRDARGRSALSEVITYPGAYHSFDHPDMPMRSRTGLAFTADGSGRAHAGSNPQAREDSIRRVLDWLGR
jgi:dienelactone hydrolase